MSGCYLNCLFLTTKPRKDFITQPASYLRPILCTWSFISQNSPSLADPVAHISSACFHTCFLAACYTKNICFALDHRVFNILPCRPSCGPLHNLMFGRCSLTDCCMILLDTEWTIHSWKKPQPSSFPNRIDLLMNYKVTFLLGLYVWEHSFISTTFGIQPVAHAVKQQCK